MIMAFSIQARSFYAVILISHLVIKWKMTSGTYRNSSFVSRDIGVIIINIGVYGVCPAILCTIRL